MTPFNRREFLTAMGLTTGSLFLPSIARAQDGPPLRFLLFYTAQGAAPQRWLCNPYGRSAQTSWDEDWTRWSEADFSDSLRPLYPWADQVTAIGGLALASAELDGDGFRHERSQAHGLSGTNAAWVNSFPYAGDMTIDQRIADHLARSDRYRSLELSVSDGLAYDGYGSVVYRGPNQPLPVIDDPRELFDRLFAFQTGSVDPVLAEQGSVLDLVAGRYKSLSARLSSRDRQKMQTHQDLVRDLEKLLVGVSTAQCPSLPERPREYGDYDLDFEAHLQLIAAAFSCDLTRVASMQMGQLFTTQLGLGPGDIHADHAHDIYTSDSGEDAMALYMAYHARQFARILELLDSIPEGDGSLLDNTVIAWLPELADSWHGMDNFATVVAGGRNSRLRQGRYIQYGKTTPVIGLQPDGNEFMGMPHQRMLISLCQSVGMNTQALGVTEVNGWDGSTIDCTGALPEMLT